MGEEIHEDAAGVINEFARAAVEKFAEPFGEGVRIQVLSGGIEKDDSGGAIGIELFQSGITVADFGDFDGARSADAFHIVVEDSAHLRTAGFAEHEKTQLHLSPYFLRFSRRVLRLMPRASAERLIW